MTDASAAAPPPPPAARTLPPGRNETVATRGAFQSALEDAQRRGGATNDGSTEDDEAGEGSATGRKRKGGDAGLMSLLGLKEPPRGASHGGSALLARPARDRKEGALEGVGAEPGGSAAMTTPGSEVAPGASAVDPAAFAEMVEQAAARGLQGGADAPITVAMNSLGSPLQAFQLARLPDGSLSLALQAEAGAVPEVSRSLETLRRRLEARGLSLGEIRVADAGETLGPSAAEGADPG